MKKTAILLSLLFVITSLTAQSKLSEDQKKFVDQYKKQPNVPKPEEMKINTDAEPDLTSGFESLYNGKDLSGWTPKGGISKFEAKGDEIIGTCVKGSPSTYFSTDKSDYTDFIFTCEIKWEVDGNTGVMFRAQSKKGKKYEDVFGPQAEMEGFAKKRGWSGGIYGQSCGGWYYPLWLDAHKEARETLKKDDWNRITIKAEGNNVKTWINGIPAANWDTDQYMKGFFSLQIHAGSKGTVHFRNIKVKELK